jgi:integrase
MATVRIRYGSGRVRLPVPDLPNAELRLRRLAELLGPPVKEAEARVVLLDAAQQTTEQAFAEAEAIARELAAAAGVNPRERAPATFRDVAELWLSGELHARYPDDVAPKSPRSVAGTRALLAVVYPALGETPLGQITLEHCERAKALVPSHLARNSRRHYAIAIRRVLAFAVYPLRLLEQSPIPPKWVPRMTGTRTFPFIYPDEEARLLSCKKILPSDRLMYAFLARTGLRVSQAAALTWKNVDLRLGALKLPKHKRQPPRSFRLPPDLVAALAASRDPNSPLLFPEFRLFNTARRFREDLLGADIDRAELHESTDEQRRMRIHDLRGSFVTLALAAGASETWVMDRTGHTTSTMLNAYRRAARHASELELGWFGPVTWPIGVGHGVGQNAEFPWKTAPNHTPSWSNKGRDVHGTEPNQAPASAPIDASRRPGPAEIDGVGQNSVELILAESLRKAIDAERWELAQDIARELGERRRERTAPSIPSLDSARARKGHK